jgi:hypothetical protein
MNDFTALRKVPKNKDKSSLGLFVYELNKIHAKIFLLLSLSKNVPTGLISPFLTSDVSRHFS